MNDNKLLLTHYQGKLLALFMSNNRLLSVKVYEEEKASLVGNIYVGKIQNMAKGIDAAFVEIADKEVCFLPFDNCKHPSVLNRTVSDHSDHQLKAGDTLLVQVVRDAIKTKQPVASASISLAGNYLAVSEGSEKLGISNKIPEAKKQEIILFLQETGLIDGNRKCQGIKEGTGVVIRTNSGTLNDFTPILQEWHALNEELQRIFEVAPYRTAFSCLKKNDKPYLEDLKGYYTGEIDEIVTDSNEVYHELLEYVTKQKETCGIELPAIRQYTDEYPLEKLYSIKTHIDEALGSRVWLKSGGYLVIEPTEALTVIDVNSGKYEASKHTDSDELFFRINMEAAEEIARQLRLRNLSGIIVVDFINMDEDEKKKQLMDRLKILTAKDSVRTTVVDITALGLVEITRKRVNRPLRELLR